MRQHLLLALPSALLATLALACDPPAPDVSQLDVPIVDGTFEEGEDAVVTVLPFGGVGLCTGTLIAPNVVLTAKHCVQAADAGDDDDSDDALIQEALRAMLERKQASASMLQTQLKVGYARARRLLIAMEKKGWVGPPEGSKPRKILYSGPPPGR